MMKTPLIEEDSCDYYLDFNDEDESSNEKANIFFCQMCYQYQFIENFTTLKCQHKFCSFCLQEFYVCLLDDSLGTCYLQITCPDKRCNRRKLERSEIESILNEEYIKKYEKSKEVYDVLNSKDLIYCPNPDCGAIVRTYFLWNKTLCQECNQYFCKQCQIDWHSNKTCEQIQNEIYGEWLGQKDSTKCPVCKMRVEKTQGCQHIICPVCTYEWCWICGLSYQSFVHQAQAGGMICELIGGSYFSFTGFRKYLIIFLLFIFFPLIIFLISLFAIGYLIMFLWKKLVKFIIKLPLRNHQLKLPKFLKAPLQLLGLMFLTFLLVFIILATLFLIIVCGSALFLISLVPMYVFLVFGFIRIKKQQKIVCENCAQKFDRERACEMCTKQYRGTQKNFQASSSVTDQIKRRDIPSNFLLKEQVRIGFLHPDFDATFFYDMYLNQYKFYENIQGQSDGVSVFTDDKSLLQQKVLEINLKKNFFYTQVLHELNMKLLRSQKFLFTIVEPYYNQNNLTTSQEYQSYISEKFDMVCIQHQYPLEPNYLIIQDIPDDVDIDYVKKENLLKANINQKYVIVNKLQNPLPNRVNILFDFKGNKEDLEQFDNHLNEFNLRLKDNEVVTLRKQDHPYYYFLYSTQKAETGQMGRGQNKFNNNYQHKKPQRNDYDTWGNSQPNRQFDRENRNGNNYYRGRGQRRNFENNNGRDSYHNREQNNRRFEDMSTDYKNESSKYSKQSSKQEGYEEQRYQRRDFQKPYQNQDERRYQRKERRDNYDYPIEEEKEQNMDDLRNSNEDVKELIDEIGGSMNDQQSEPTISMQQQTIPSMQSHHYNEQSEMSNFKRDPNMFNLDEKQEKEKEKEDEEEEQMIDTTVKQRSFGRGQRGRGGGQNQYQKRDREEKRDSPKEQRKDFGWDRSNDREEENRRNIERDQVPEEEPERPRPEKQFGRGYGRGNQRDNKRDSQPKDFGRGQKRDYHRDRGQDEDNRYDQSSRDGDNQQRNSPNNDNEYGRGRSRSNGDRGGPPKRKFGRGQR